MALADLEDRKGLQAKECGQPLEAEKGQKTSPRASGKEHSSADIESSFRILT